jgi:hypothetical protein
MGAEKADEPEDPAQNGKAHLHHVAPFVCRLTLSEQGAIVELKARWLLGEC